MGRSSTKKKRLLERKAELDVKRRNGLMRVIAAIVIFVVVATIKTSAALTGAAWASNAMINMGFFIGVLVLAGLAGYGSRDYRRASNEIRAIEEKLMK